MYYLKDLKLGACEKLGSLPEGFGELEHLKQLYMGCCDVGTATAVRRNTTCRLLWMQLRAQGCQLGTYHGPWGAVYALPK